MTNQNAHHDKPKPGQQHAEDLGVFGPRLDQVPKGPDGIHILNHNVRLLTGKPSAEEVARRELYVKMAANMIIMDEPRGYYFVREPGL